MRVENGFEGVREGIELAGLDQRDGAAAVLDVVVVVLAAVGHHVRLRGGESVPRKDGVAHAGGEDLAGREDELVGDVAQRPGHLHAAGQAGVQDEVTEVVRDGGSELVEFEELDLRADVLAANGARCRIAVVTRRHPATSVGGNDHAVTARGELLPDLIHHLADRLRRGAVGHVGVGLEGVADRLAVATAIDAHQHGRVGRDVIAGRRGCVDEGQDGLVVPQGGEDVALEVLEVLLEVAAEVVIAHAVVNQDLVVRPLEGAVQAVAGGQENGREQQQICPKPTHLCKDSYFAGIFLSLRIV